MTITEFLLTRIAEDETVARAASRDRYSVEGGLRYGDTGYNTLPDLTIDPARLLAECEAKRRIVEFLRPDPSMPVDSGRFVAAAVQTLLALPYADHPDYREEWRP